MKNRTRPKCQQNRKDCFAYTESGRCICLKDTRFSYKCPFYKRFDEVYDENGRYK